MNDSIFRKSSMERISSPEQLNEYIKSLNPGVWMLLAAFIGLAAGACIWAFTSTVLDTVKTAGTVLPQDDRQVIRAYVPFDDAVSLRAGMDVQVSPTYAPRESYGFIYGTVESVSESPVYLENGAGAANPSGDTAAEVVIALVAENGNIKWSAGKGASVELVNHSGCDVTIITNSRRPIDLLLGNMG